MTFKDSAKDPVTGAVASTQYFFIKSDTSTGTSTDVVNDVTIPSSPNFPVSPAAQTRYMINLPGTPNYNGVVAATHPWIVKNVNSSTILSRVAYDGTLTANTYKIFPNTQQRVNAMEVHVGVGSGTADDVIAFQGYFENFVISSSDYNNLNVSTLTVNSTITGNVILSSTGKLATGGETSPDCSQGGLTLNQGGADDEILTFKSSDVAHGLATYETDTYGVFQKRTGGTGGLNIIGLGGNNSLKLEARSTNNALMNFNVTENGSAAGSTEIIYTFLNDDSIKVHIKGDGEIFAGGAIQSNGMIYGVNGLRTEYQTAAAFPTITQLQNSFGIVAGSSWNGFLGLFYDSAASIGYNISIINGVWTYVAVTGAPASS